MPSGKVWTPYSPSYKLIFFLAENFCTHLYYLIVFNMCQYHLIFFFAGNFCKHFWIVWKLLYTPKWIYSWIEYFVKTIFDLIWFGSVLWHINHYRSFLCIYILNINMIWKHILLIKFLNKPKLILLNTAKWFQILLCITNNSTSVICLCKVKWSNSSISNNSV